MIQPIKLINDRVWRTYRGGKLLDMWSNQDNPSDTAFPEEWIGSLTRAINTGREDLVEGYSKACVDGKIVSLLSLVGSDPSLYLGEGHVSKYGVKPSVLVKALDSSERLTIQVHPDKKSAKRLFNSDFGKTEAWYIMDTRDDVRPYILLGFKPGITRERWQKLFAEQDTDGMQDALNKVYVRPGDVFLINGGVPHAIGAGCFILEIQEPTDYTIRVEKTTPSGLEIADALCHQGLGFEKMLDCFSYDGYTHAEVTEKFKLGVSAASDREQDLISYADTRCFALKRAVVKRRARLEDVDSFSILVVEAGEGEINAGACSIAVRQGDSLFLPCCLKSIACKTNSSLKILRCLPPRE